MNDDRSHHVLCSRFMCAYRLKRIGAACRALEKGEIVNSPNLLPLKEWAKRQYGDAAPHRNTLLKWVRDGRIQPQPKKQGRAYFFKPEAEYK